MLEELPVTVTYIIPHDYRKTLRSVRRAFEKDKLEIWMERDVGHTIRRSLSIDFGRVTILGVVCPFALLRIVVAGTAALSLLPLHVVVAEHGDETYIHVLNTARISSGAPNAAAFRLEDLVARVETALVRAGAHKSAGAAHA